MDDRFAVDLLWVRPGQVGGTEVVIRQILDGWLSLREHFDAVLIVTRDNRDTWSKYAEDPRFEILTAPVDAAGIAGRILWQNLHLASFLRKNGLYHCFSPVYDRPFFNGGIRYITTIHDIQAYHYPHYHPLHEVVYSKWAWQADKRHSIHNICISSFVREDLIRIYRFDPEKLTVIGNPVSVDPKEMADFSLLSERYGIRQGEYYYTLSQMIPHKNTVTLLKVFAAIRDRGESLPQKLVISGIRGNATDEVNRVLEELHLKETVILTGFVDDAERNALYRYARAFLFASVFEGFGIPPVEAMLFHTPVVTTRCACIPEVTQGLADYVDDPYDVDDWIRKMHTAEDRSDRLDLSQYDVERIAASYLQTIRRYFGMRRKT